MVRPKKRPEDGWPTRRDQRYWTAAESAIYEAIQTVEAMGAHTLLTEAVICLESASNYVADFAELEPPLTPFGEATNLLDAARMAMSPCPLREDIESFLKRFPVRDAEPMRGEPKAKANPEAELGAQLPRRGPKYNPINGG